jgi:ketosteroid isomerase-like protein
VKEEWMMSSDDTMKILERHGAATQANDLDAVMADYADDAVLISPRHGVLRGSEIRTFFEHPSDLSGFEVTSLFVDDDVAFFTWRTDAVAFGSDTFVVRDDKITIQSVAMPAD